MQSTILFLQQELKTAKDTIGSLEAELAPLRSKSADSPIVATANTAAAADAAQSNGDAAAQPALTNGLSATGDTAASQSVSNQVQSNTSASEVSVDEVRTLRSGRGGVTFAETAAHHNGNEALDTKATPSNGGQLLLNGGGGGGAKRTFADSEAAHVNTVQVVSAKKIRRASVLSLDLNEEDSRIECDDERTLLAAAAPCNGVAAEAGATAAEAVALPSGNAV